MKELEYAPDCRLQEPKVFSKLGTPRLLSTKRSLDQTAYDSCLFLLEAE